ncbi:Ger(x)C family spore germination protein [Metabacillus fastidiosus]|uniref:Ger(x)C family spore germination protein n=1 Tax=Metabacillus fastidiosus TaxID=1458 RepID=UPI002E239B8C|nr:Ger(x)C family spore germination protein [Metabacillus fastidiosus]
MKSRIFVIITVISILISLTGCWNRRELNEMAIVVGIGIDKVDDQFLVTTQVINPGQVATQKSSIAKAPVIMYQETGDTVFEAIRKITTTAPRKMYASHLRMIVLGEEFAKDGIGEILDILLRDQEFRMDFYIMVAQGMKAKDILKVSTPLEKIPSNKMFNALETSQKEWSATKAVTLHELVKTIVREGEALVLTGITVKGDKGLANSMDNLERTVPNGDLQITNLAVFKKDKLIGWLDEMEGKTYNVLTNNEKSTTINLSCPKGGKVVYEVKNSSTDPKAEIRNGKPEIDLDIFVEGDIAEVECDMDLSKAETIKEIEKMYEKEAKSYFRDAISQIQEHHEADIFGFGEEIHRKNPEIWRKIKDNWDQQFKYLPVNIKVRGEIKQIGTIENSVLEKLEKQREMDK